MAGPSVAVKVLADVKNLSDSFSSTSSTASGAASRIKGAFTGALGVLNQSGVLGPFGAAIDGAISAVDQLGQHSKSIGTNLIGVGGIMAGVGASLQALGSKDQAAHQQLQASVEATGKDYEDFAGRVEEAIKHQENFGHSAGETQDALSKLTQATHDPEKALALLNETTDVAAAKHEDLSAAATAVGKVYNGNTKLLKEFGVTIDKTTGQTVDHKTATQALADVTAGQAAAATDTFAGKLDAVKTKVEDAAAAFGQKYGPALTIGGTAMAGLGGAIEAVTAIQAAFAAAEWLSLGPMLLIIAAVAVLGVAIYELVSHWSAVWGAMQAAVAWVWNWIAANWPLLLAILLGPIGVAADLIIKNWDRIKNAFADVYNFIVGTWNMLVGFFGTAISGLARVFQHMWDGMLAPFRLILNTIIDLWNQLHFTLPKVDVLGVHIGGETIGVPSIPHLAQGGLMTADGLVYAHAGEVITPAPARTGPAVNIENVNISDGADLELMLSKIRFATLAGRL
jgi:hypothetical protein